ncbi:hypothetical protein GGX14DRAFT_408961 [Mycena pura]|uniref:Uncharacterized protein n=1 Tax=Mycena pura TaxID=153505 RepID=A0AAD6XYY7_9AGAR|nr:hypothetical protein GGX14DRAFT_408961 [Mycena pura]
MTGSEALENAPTFPARLTVPKDSRLKIFVEHSGTSQNKKPTNKARVVFWRFPAQFPNEHFNKPSGAAAPDPRMRDREVGQKGFHRICSCNVRDSSFEGRQNDEKFGQDGEMRAQEVMDQASATSTDGAGRALIKFLDDWNKSHTE